MHVETFAVRRIKRPFTRAGSTGGSAGVEPQHCDSGERRQAPRHLAQYVTVHHPAVRGQRMHAYHRAPYRPVDRQGQFADECVPVSRHKAKRLSICREHTVRDDFRHQYRGPWPRT